MQTSVLRRKEWAKETSQSPSRQKKMGFGNLSPEPPSNPEGQSRRMAMQGRTAGTVDLTMLGDLELVQLARQRDGGAFRIIMQRHNQRLYRVARAVTRDDSE